MALFLVVHELDTHDPEAFVAAWSAGAASHIRCLKHWVSGDAIALLAEAPNEYGLRAYDSDAIGVTELFAPARRWLSYETIDLPPRARHRHAPGEATVVSGPPRHNPLHGGQQ
jgi:hypothetical protein